jgi:hypothetical protein
MKVRDDGRAAEASAAIGGVSLRPSSMTGWYLVQLADGVSVDDAVARAQGNPLIETVEPNFTGFPSSPVESGPQPFTPKP